MVVGIYAAADIYPAIENYSNYGFGLWGVILKESKQFIGDCGVTMQEINGNMEPEIGYHINKKYANKGYATEAARACRNYAFEVLKLKQIYSYMKYTNIASINELKDEKNGITKIYTITLDEYLSKVNHRRI